RGRAFPGPPRHLAKPQQRASTVEAQAEVTEGRRPRGEPGCRILVIPGRERDGGGTALGRRNAPWVVLALGQVAQAASDGGGLLRPAQPDQRLDQIRRDR